MKLSKPEIIGEAVQMACLFEVSSEKPGNVTPTRQFSDLSYADFLHNAVVLGRVFRNNAKARVGEIILQSVSQCVARTRTNVNLGTILLLAPLARAYYNRGKIDSSAVKPVLASLTTTDADKAYKAIRLANPGGLGHVKNQDVNKKPSVTLLRAMKLAAERDWIAFEYANNFTITFELGVPELVSNIESGLVLREAIVQTFLRLLYLYPDSHVARRTSRETALKISEKAGGILRKGGLASPSGRRAVYEFDHYLRSDSNMLNPGTTADLVAAALFVYFIQNRCDTSSPGKH